MPKRTTRLIALLMLLTLLPFPAQGETSLFHFWGIRPTMKPDAFIALVKERSGIVMNATPYGDSMYLYSDSAQSIVMFGMPASLSAVFENDRLDHIGISYSREGGIFYEASGPTVEQRDEAALQGLAGFLEIAKQLEETYGQFTGGQISESGESFLDFPVDGQGRLDLAAFQAMMWSSNETTLELYNRNIMIGLKTFYDYDEGGEEVACMSLYVTFSYGSTAAHGRVLTFPGAYPDMEALAATVQAAMSPKERAQVLRPQREAGKATDTSTAQPQHLLWDIPIDQGEAAYIRAFQTERGITLSQPNGSGSHYRSAKNAGLTLYGKPVTLSVNCYQGRPSFADFSVFEQYAGGDYIDDPGRIQVKNEFLDYQQTLVKELSAKYGPPTGGYMDTDEADEGGIMWNYPGTADGRLDRALMDTVIATEGYCGITVWWDNVRMSIGLETTGVQNLYASVDYFYGDSNYHVTGFDHGAAYKARAGELTF